jgi:ceramide glucosyltransferase
LDVEKTPRRQPSATQFGIFVFPHHFLYKVRLHRLAEIAAVITVASLVYCCLSIWAGVRFSFRATMPPPADLPPISILKPLKGTDPAMYESFRSHCRQNFPDYELIFGVSDAADPAATLVKNLRAEFPDRAIRLCVCDKRLGANGKVSVLAQLAAIAKYDFFVVNDSDIRVEPDYLRTIISELQQPNTGLVTCLYRGTPSNTIFSRLESLGISTDFVPGVLVAGQIEGGLKFGLGSTLAFRRTDLERIGGFEAIADYLADDYEVGKRISSLGFKVALSRITVETFLPPYRLSDFLSHQLRWARTIRASRPGGYAGLLLTYTLPWSILALVLNGGAHWAWWLLAVAVLLRFSVGLAAGVSVLREKHFGRSLWLLPIRDILAPTIWFAGIFGREIVWRGEKFKLKKGKLTPIKK